MIHKNETGGTKEKKHNQSLKIKKYRLNNLRASVG